MPAPVSTTTRSSASDPTFDLIDNCSVSLIGILHGPTVFAPRRRSAERLSYGHNSSTAGGQQVKDDVRRTSSRAATRAIELHRLLLVPFGLAPTSSLDILQDFDEEEWDELLRVADVHRVLPALGGSPIADCAPPDVRVRLDASYFTGLTFHLEAIETLGGSSCSLDLPTSSGPRSRGLSSLRRSIPVWTNVGTAMWTYSSTPAISVVLSNCSSERAAAWPSATGRS